MHRLMTNEVPCGFSNLVEFWDSDSLDLALAADCEAWELADRNKLRRT
jgi:hypothetical protein